MQQFARPRAARVLHECVRRRESNTHRHGIE
jgi:hypothetical protein